MVEGANYLCLQPSFCSSTAEHIPEKNQINWQVQVQSSKPDLPLPPHVPNKETNPEYSLEGLMVKLKLQHSGHLTRRADALEKTLTLGKTEARRRGQKKMRWLDGITDSMDMN